MGVHCCFLHVKYTVYKHFGKLLRIESLDPTCVQNFRPVQHYGGHNALDLISSFMDSSLNQWYIPMLLCVLLHLCT